MDEVINEQQFNPSSDRNRARTSRASRSLRGWSAIALCGLLISASGCATGGNIISAEKLPQDYVAAHNENTQIIDLSKLATGSVNSDLLAKGDTLEVNIIPGMSSKETFNWTVRVENDGSAQLPLIGSVPLGGRELEDAEATITRACVERNVFRAPSVSVNIKRKKMNRVTVIGAVKSPGVKMIPTGESDLLSALVAAGGLAENAGTHVEMRNVIEPGAQRNDSIANGAMNGIIPTGYATGSSPQKNVRVDLVSAAKEGSNGYYIGDGGVIMVEQRDPKAVHVGGLVKKPGRIEYPVSQDMYLLEVLGAAGWTSSQVADKVFVIRQIPGQAEPIVIQCSIDRAERELSHNVRLAPGDVITVKHTPATVMMEGLNIIRFGVSTSLAPLLF